MVARLQIVGNRIYLPDGVTEGVYYENASGNWIGKDGNQNDSNAVGDSNKDWLGLYTQYFGGYIIPPPSRVFE